MKTRQALVLVVKGLNFPQRDKTYSSDLLIQTYLHLGGYSHQNSSFLHSYTCMEGMVTAPTMAAEERSHMCELATLSRAPPQPANVFQPKLE